uniref:Pancreatic trypsin inhibitor n=1 Tax=Rhipicephalus appendiculatus TaxID=34631 RepID=A0A131Z505_RHIAP
MASAYAFRLIVIAFLFSPVLLSEGRNVRNDKCSKEATVEGCDTVLLGWSFSPQHNKCVKGFSCSDIANRFEKEWQCEKTCPPVSGRRPEIKVLVMWSCQFWLKYGGACQTRWYESYTDKNGRKCRLLYYTGCGAWKHKLYTFDFCRRRCRVYLGRRNKFPPGKPQ